MVGYEIRFVSETYKAKKNAPPPPPPKGDEEEEDEEEDEYSPVKDLDPPQKTNDGKVQNKGVAIPEKYPSTGNKKRAVMMETDQKLESDNTAGKSLPDKEDNSIEVIEEKELNMPKTQEGMSMDATIQIQGVHDQSQEVSQGVAKSPTNASFSQERSEASPPAVNANKENTMDEISAGSTVSLSEAVRYIQSVTENWTEGTEFPEPTPRVEFSTLMEDNSTKAEDYGSQQLQSNVLEELSVKRDKSQEKVTENVQLGLTDQVEHIGTSENREIPEGYVVVHNMEGAYLLQKGLWPRLETKPKGSGLSKCGQTNDEMKDDTQGKDKSLEAIDALDNLSEGEDNIKNGDDDQGWSQTLSQFAKKKKANTKAPLVATRQSARLRNQGGITVGEKAERRVQIKNLEIGLAWALWTTRNKMSIQKDFPDRPIDVIYVAVSYLQKWKLLLKKKTRMEVDSIATRVLLCAKNFKASDVSVTDITFI